MAKNQSSRYTKEDTELAKENPDKAHAYADDEMDMDIYTKTGEEALREDDEIADWEEGFMEGESGEGMGIHCSHCGKAIGDDPNKAFERIIDGKLRTFCSQKCSAKGLKQ